MHRHTTPDLARRAGRATLALAMLAACLAPAAAQAETVSFDHAFSDTIALLAAGSGLAPHILTPRGYFSAALPTFNTSLGTLNSATVNWTVQETVSLTSVTPFNFTLNMNLATSSLQADGNTYVGTAGGGSLSVVVAPGASVNRSIGFTRSDMLSAANQPAVFNLFTDGPDVNLLYNGFSSASYARIAAGGQVVVAGSVSVIYDYTPNAVPPAGNNAPEPGSLALVAAAGLAAAWGRRSR